MPLKPEQVASEIQSGKNRKIADGRSLYLVVRNGRGFWVYEYRHGNSRHSHGLGSAANMSPAAARRAREDFAVERRKPLFVPPRKHRGRALMTTTATAGAPRQAPMAGAGKAFGEAHATYLTNHADEWSPYQQVAIARLFKNHTGSLDPLPVGSITVEQVADVLRPLWRGPAAGSGARLRQLMEHVFRAAGVKGEANPALWDSLRDLLSKKTVKAKAHPAMAYAELPAFMIELAGERVRECKSGAGRPPNKATGDFDAVSRCLRFCILTATRSNEAIGADWSEIDLAKRQWKIPAARMKMDSEHTIPLSDAAIALLGTPKRSGRVFTVSSTRSGEINKDGLLKHLREYRTVETVHGMRASFASWAEDARFMPDVIEASLAHEKGDANARAYRRSKLLPARRELMDAWATFTCGVGPLSPP
jgi:integrase